MNVLKSRIAAVSAGALLIAGLSATGGAVAGSMVGSPQIHDNSIRSKDIRDGAVSGKDIRNGVEASIRKRATWNWVDREFARKGATGTPGEPGKDGEDGVSGAVTHKPVDSIARDVAPGEKVTVTAKCEPGTVALSGGYEVEAIRSPGLEVLRNQPTGEYVDGMFNAWSVQVLNGSEQTVTVQPAVVCAIAN